MYGINNLTALGHQDISTNTCNKDLVISTSGTRYNFMFSDHFAINRVTYNKWVF